MPSVVAALQAPADLRTATWRFLAAAGARRVGDGHRVARRVGGERDDGRAGEEGVDRRPVRACGGPSTSPVSRPTITRPVPSIAIRQVLLGSCSVGANTPVAAGAERQAASVGEGQATAASPASSTATTGEPVASVPAANWPPMPCGGPNAPLPGRRSRRQCCSSERRRPAQRAPRRFPRRPDRVAEPPPGPCSSSPLRGAP